MGPPVRRKATWVFPRQGISLRVDMGSAFPNLSAKKLLEADSDQSPRENQHFFEASLICHIHTDVIVHQGLPVLGQGRRARRVYSLPFGSCQRFSAPEVEGQGAPGRIISF